MAIHAGFEYSRSLVFRSGGAALNVSAWQLRIRVQSDADLTKQFTLTVGDGIAADPVVQGRVVLTISQDRTALLPAGRAKVTVSRVDGGRNIFLFSGRIEVKA